MKVLLRPHLFKKDAGQSFVMMGILLELLNQGVERLLHSYFQQQSKYHLGYVDMKLGEIGHVSCKI